MGSDHRANVVVFEDNGVWWWGLMTTRGRLVAVSPVEYATREEAVIGAMGNVALAVERWNE